MSLEHAVLHPLGEEEEALDRETSEKRERERGGGAASLASKTKGEEESKRMSQYVSLFAPLAARLASRQFPSLLRQNRDLDELYANRARERNNKKETHRYSALDWRAFTKARADESAPVERA